MSLHALQRAAERLGLSLTQRDLDRMIQRIHQGKAVYIEPGSESGTVLYDVTCRHRVVRAVYCPKARMILTIYAMEASPARRVEYEGKRRDWRRKRLDSANIHLEEGRTEGR